MIGLDGTVTGVKVRESIPALDAAAMAAVRQWRYAPYIVDGTPISIAVTVTVRFDLTQTGRGPNKNKRASRPDLLKLARKFGCAPRLRSQTIRRVRATCISIQTAT